MEAYVAASHPSIADSAVVGVQDFGTEFSRAFVALHPGTEADQKTAKDIRHYNKQPMSARTAAG